MKGNFDGKQIYVLIKGLNMFLVPIKLGPFQFNPYLILIVLLVPKKISAVSINPYSIQICLIYD